MVVKLVVVLVAARVEQLLLILQTGTSL